MLTTGKNGNKIHSVKTTHHRCSLSELERDQHPRALSLTYYFVEVAALFLNMTATKVSDDCKVGFPGVDAQVHCRLHLQASKLRPAMNRAWIVQHWTRTSTKRMEIEHASAALPELVRRVQPNRNDQNSNSISRTSLEKSVLKTPTQLLFWRGTRLSRLVFQFDSL